jgi:hypothetical protein
MSSAPQPSLLWSFNGSTRDSILGIDAPATGSFTYVNGKYNNGISIPQGTNFLITPTLPVTFSNVQGLTCSIWFSLTANVNNNNYLFGINAGGSGSANAVFRLSARGGSTGSDIALINTATNVTYAGGPRAPFNAVLGVWNHVAFTFNSTSWALYLNGIGTVNTGTYTVSGAAPNLNQINGPIYFAEDAAGFGNANTVVFNDFRIYNQALSAQQILGIYQSQGIPPRLTITPSTGGLPSPAYAWQFEGTTADVGGLQGTNFGPSQLNGSVSYITNLGTNLPPGGSSNVASFTGGAAGTRINTGLSWSLAQTGSSSNIFVEALVYVNSFPCTIALQGPPLATAQWWCGFNSQGYFSANVYAGGVQQTANCIGTPVSIGTWANVAFTYQQNTATSNTMFVWTNGGSQGFNTFSGTVNNTFGNWYIGGDTNLASMSGYISDLRIIIGGTPITTAIFSNAITPYSLTPPTGTNNSEVAYTIQSQFSNNYTTSGQYGQALTNTSIQYAISFPAGTAISASMWVNLLLQPQYVDQFFATNNFTMSLVNNTRGPTGSGSPYNFIMQNSSSLYNLAQGALRAVLNGWYHVVGVYDSTGYATYYINGTITTLGNPQQAVPVATTYIIIAGGKNIFKGYIDDVRIYNTALSAAQIKTIYQSGGNLYGAQTVQPALLWSFNGSNVDSVSSVVPSTFTGCTYTPGKLAQALSIINTTSDGTNSATYPVNVNDSGNLSFCFWVNIISNSLANSPTIFQFNVSTSGSTYLQLFITGSPGNFFLQSSSPSSLIMNANGLPVNYGSWYHMAVVTNGSTITWYINNIIYTQSGFTNPRSYTGNGAYATLNIGRATSGNGVSNNMIINDFRIYNTALSAQQILGIYQSQGIPPSLTMTQTSRSGTSTTMNSG